MIKDHLDQQCMYVDLENTESSCYAAFPDGTPDVTHNALLIEGKTELRKLISREPWPLAPFHGGDCGDAVTYGSGGTVVDGDEGRIA